MQIEIHATGFDLSNAIREHLERRVLFALSRIATRVKRVVVHLADINGPRGGIDKRCSVQVHLVSSPVVVIEEVDADVYVVLDRALSRAGRSASKRIERSQQFARIGATWTADDKLREIRDRRRRLPITQTNHEYD